jgi:DNA-binding response OmpR family regulator
MDSQKHILIIDDHEDTVSLLEDFLGDNGFQLSTALTGQAGLNQIVEKRPDIIILDMVLPDMSGADICAQLRNNPATRDIPIIVCTAHKVSLEEKMKGFRAGVDDYLIRPFELAELLARINAILRRSQARPKADVLADIQTLLSQPKKGEPALPPLPQAVTSPAKLSASLAQTKNDGPAIKPEPQQPFEVFRRWWQVLNLPKSVFEKPRYGHDFFTALMYVIATPIVASVAKISDKTAGFDGWIGAFSLGIVTNLVMWLATGGLLHLTLPFLGINLTMRRSLSISRLA